LATIAGRVPELADLPVGCPFAERCARAADDCRASLPAEVPIDAAARPLAGAAAHLARCLHMDAGAAATA
jgi:peptide/nickel transport system ATP-binding protein